MCKKNSVTQTNITDYQKLVGKLIYLSHTRPDIAYDVHYLSLYIHKPYNSNLQIALRLLRYLKGAPGKGVLFTKSDTIDLRAYSDSDWAKCLETSYCVSLGRHLVAWKSKKSS